MTPGRPSPPPWWYSAPEGVDPFTDTFEVNAYGVAVRVPWISHIVGNLYVGGVAPGLKLPERFTTVVSVHIDHAYDISPGHEPEVLSKGLVDSVSAPLDMRVVHRLAVAVREGCQRGPTLVHCQAGINRSAMVAAFAMVQDGYSADQAIGLIRSQRCVRCLCNSTFEAAVRAYNPREFSRG